MTLPEGSVALLFETPRAHPVELRLPCREHPDDLWFSQRPREVEQAKQLCQDCPIRPSCLQAALRRGEPWGVWGGHLLEGGRIVAHKCARGRPRKITQFRDRRDHPTPRSGEVSTCLPRGASGTGAARPRCPPGPRAGAAHDRCAEDVGGGDPSLTTGLMVALFALVALRPPMPRHSSPSRWCWGACT
ncbi:WhiB family transcriptional regulator [Intrasporangium sp.]|uniref:WhiB family transcriptional regulator n=1 Tax=Intrasporangium sp. TaxID=1925024 RepID=UPI0026483959|nr:WhiB family transcriptional regulator [Intrasporangium sp.]